MEIFALIVIIVATAVWVLLPLRTATPEPAADAPGIVEELRARRHQLLLALQDLDFELQTGKLSPEDHGELRTRLQSEAVDVLRRLEEAGSEPA